MSKARKIEIDARVADVLQARAAARGLSLSELLADLAYADEALSPDLAGMREEGRGPWAAEVLAEDTRRLAEFRELREGVPWTEVREWMQSWGTTNERPAPKSRKL